MTENMETATRDPAASRPQMPDGYGVPKTDEGLLPWSWAEERLRDGINYWVGTARPDGRPHLSPIWGVWLEGKFYFEGSPETRRGRNLASNPAVAMHVERENDAVIVEGKVEEVPDPDEVLSARLVEAFAEKYEPKYNYRPDPAMWQGGGLYALVPSVVLAWHSFPGDCTRWRFTQT